MPVWAWIAIALAVVIIISARVVTFSAKRKPLEEQEKKIRDAFATPATGPRKEVIEMDPAWTKLPIDRINEIANECGYSFDRLETNPRYGNKRVFYKRRQVAE